MQHSFLKVLTFNCWGAPFSSNSDLRFQAISQKLSSENYDIVSLQEVFYTSHISMIKDATSHNLPFSHYFCNNVFGSGIFILSRYPIEDAALIPFKQTGAPYELTGDYYSGKCICYVKIAISNIKIKMLALHLHAYYHHDEYSPLRTLQIHQVASLTKTLQSKDDYFIIAGDLNTEYNEPAFQFLLNYCNLYDSGYEIYGEDCLKLFTCGDLKNKLTEKKDKTCKIDYIIYNNNLSCISSKLAFDEEFEEGIHYSDHYGFEANFVLKNDEKENDICQNPKINFEDIHQELTSGYNNVSNSWLLTNKIFNGFIIISITLYVAGIKLFPFRKLVSYLIPFFIGIYISFSFIAIVYGKIVRSNYKSSLDELEKQKNLNK